jgi:microcin C transport system permease protein
VGKRALVVSHQGSWHFPFLKKDIIQAKTFGQEGEAETDYRQLQRTWKEQRSSDWVLMPLIPFDAAQDADEITLTLQRQSDGTVTEEGSDVPFSGRAYTTFRSKSAQQRQEYTFRDGREQGDFRGWNLSGEQIEKGSYQAGQRQSYTDLSPKKDAASLSADTDSTLRSRIYPPFAPAARTQHYLGTDSGGIDILASLFGGLQQSIFAAALFVLVTLSIGILLGGAMGYIGSWLDLLGQRIVEVWTSLPFLFVVMIVSSFFSPSIIMLVILLSIFGWMGISDLIRTASMREKARDYCAAARVLGASPLRILLRHILPNTLSILVTLIPFLVTGVITSLAALDFLGFGLAPEIPSWGRLLHQGTENFNYPWIVSAAFLAIVITLILVTFVGEAVREAFDPKRFTLYR